MTRVLYVAPDPALRLDQQGGAGTHMRGTIEALLGQGFDVETVVGAPASFASAPTIAQRPAPTLRRVTPRAVRSVGRDVRLLLHARAVRSTDDAASYDCVYERSAYLVDAGRSLARRHSVPYLVETDGMLVAATAQTYGAPLHLLAERLERRKIASANAVVVMSAASAEAISALYDVASEKVLVKGLGVERSLVEDPPTAEVSVDVGFAGTFQPYHGVDLLVRALRLLDGRTSLLVGDGPTRADVEKTIDGLPVEMTGLLARDDTLARLAQCRVLVVPESSDTLYPVKVLEYAALRRPVVCPDRRAFDEFECDGEQPFYRFRPGDPSDLAQAIERALAAGADARTDALASLVADKYTWDAVGARLAERIRLLVGS